MVHLYIIWLIWQFTNHLGKEESSLVLDTNVWNAQRHQLQKKNKKTKKHLPQTSIKTRNIPGNVTALKLFILKSCF